jgi:hypothetical protein
LGNKLGGAKDWVTNKVSGKSTPKSTPQTTGTTTTVPKPTTVNSGPTIQEVPEGVTIPPEQRVTTEPVIEEPIETSSQSVPKNEPSAQTTSNVKDGPTIEELPDNAPVPTGSETKPTSITGPDGENLMTEQGGAPKTDTKNSGWFSGMRNKAGKFLKPGTETTGFAGYKNYLLGHKLQSWTYANTALNPLLGGQPGQQGQGGGLLNFGGLLGGGQGGGGLLG